MPSFSLGCSYSANAGENLIHHLIKEYQSCCRLCGSIKDVTYCKNLLNKANEELHATAQAVYGRSSTHLIITSE